MMWLAGLIICMGWIISLCFHEFAHALVAYCGGDTSVKDKGYLTFNPLKYTQPGLSLLMPLVFILIGGIGLPGGAVYINHKLLRNRAWSSWVSAAGPIASLMFALLLVTIFRILASMRSDQEWVIVALPSVAYLIYIEFGAVLLNLFPIPPLDGSGIIQPWLPAKINQQLEQYSNFSYYFIFGLFLFVPGFGSFFSGILRSTCKFLGVAPVAIGYGSDLFNLPVNKLITILILAIIAYSLRFNEATWYRKGHKLAVSKKDQEAIAAYEQAIKIQPKYLDAWLGKADALFRLGLYAESAIAYETAFSLTTKQDFHSSSKYLIQALLHIGKLEQAINIADQGIAEDPQEYCFWECKAACLYKQEKYQPVIDLCRAGIEACGDRIWLNYYLAASLKRLNQYQAARAIYTQIITIEPENLSFLSEIAHLFYLEQNYTSAIRNFKKITMLKPDYSHAWYNLACCYALQTNTVQALAALKKAVAITPQETRKLASEDKDFASLHQELGFIALIKC